MHRWLISKGGTEEGPYTAVQVAEMLSNGELRTSEALARREHETNWRKLAVSGVLAEASMAGVKRPDGLPTPSIVIPKAPPPAVAGEPDSPLAPAAAAPVDPYRAPAKLEIGPAFEPDETLYPGIGRLAYFLLQMGMTFVFYFLLFIGIKTVGGAGLEGVALVGMVAGILVAIAGLYLGVKRVQNLGMSGWAVLWSLVPIMNIWIGWRMYACPPGYEYHRQLDLAGKILTGLLIGLFVLSIVLNIAAAVIGAGDL